MTRLLKSSALALTIAIVSTPAAFAVGPPAGWSAPQATAPSENVPPVPSATVQPAQVPSAQPTAAIVSPTPGGGLVPYGFAPGSSRYVRLDLQRY
jgi:hypothetical protein